MQFVYSLDCKEGKKYIGQTNNIIRRFKEHKTGEGAAWTNRFTAESITKLEETTGKDFKELAWTLEAMAEYGIQNVRGGPFCRVELTTQDIKTIVELMKSNAFPGKYTPMECDAELFNESGEVESPQSRRERTGSRAGLIWTEKEDQLLLEQLKENTPLADIASLTKRSESAIYERRKMHIRRLVGDGVARSVVAEMFHIDIEVVARALA
jgi:predicted GIY-YIG superfamily endonuclease